MGSGISRPNLLMPVVEIMTSRGFTSAVRLNRRTSRIVETPSWQIVQSSRIGNQAPCFHTGETPMPETIIAVVGRMVCETLTGSLTLPVITVRRDEIVSGDMSWVARRSMSFWGLRTTGG